MRHRPDDLLCRLVFPLPLVCQAIGDVVVTSTVLDEIIVNMSAGGAKHEAIDNLFRVVLLPSLSWRTLKTAVLVAICKHCSAPACRSVLALLT
jgi:hypothetical protein